MNANKSCARIEFYSNWLQRAFITFMSASLFEGIEYESEERDACSLHANASLSSFFVSTSNQEVNVLGATTRI